MRNGIDNLNFFIYKMTNKEITTHIEVYNSIEELKNDDAFLLSEARAVTQFAYAPYSNFRVGAFARLMNGESVSGSNQENAAYPAGICAERTLLSTASSLFPGVGIESIAISYRNGQGKSDHPISPCGICRQTFIEFQKRTGHPIRVILGGIEGEVFIIENAKDLLPLVFDSGDMK